MKKVIEEPNVYTKEQILSSKRYRNNQDELNVILKNNRSYSHLDIDNLIKNFNERKVR